jgi:ORF6N domain
MEAAAIPIIVVRGKQVMLDSQLAKIYRVATKRLNEQLRRNRGTFPKDFASQLAQEEFTNLKSQSATSSLHGGKRQTKPGAS